MQLQLFSMENDKRVEKMRYHIRSEFINNRFWYPTAKQIVEIGDEFRVQGSKPLQVFEEEMINYVDQLILDHSNEWGVDGEFENDDSDVIKFYTNKLKNAKKRI